MELSSKVLLTVLLAPSVFGRIIDESKPTQLFHKIGKRLGALQNTYRIRNVEENVDDCCFDDSNDSGSDDNTESNANSLSPSTSPSTSPTNQPTTRSEGISNAMFNIYTALGTTTVDLTAATYCSWNGVTCDSDNIEPTSIVLSDENLTGYLATDIGKITELTELDLSSNQLTGTLPVELSKNTLLNELNIRDNLMSGPVPEVLNELTSLMILDLRENMLTGTLPDLSGLSVDYLQMGYNMLTGTINPLELPSDLKKIWLFGNGFTGSIPDVSGFSALSNLLLFENELSSTIPDASKLPSTLEFLGLYDNDLTGPLPDLSSLPLIYFDISNNELDGQSLPTWLFGMDSSSYIYLSGAQFTGPIPSELYTSMSEEIFISQNQLTGTISSGIGGIGTMTNLKIFDISDNDFTQSFDPSWATWFDAMTALEEFDISDNNFGGTLMNTLCDVDFNYEGNSITYICV